MATVFSFRGAHVAGPIFSDVNFAGHRNLAAQDMGQVWTGDIWPDGHWKNQNQSLRFVEK